MRKDREDSGEHYPFKIKLPEIRNIYGENLALKILTISECQAHGKCSISIFEQMDACMFI